MRTKQTGRNNRVSIRRTAALIAAAGFLLAACSGGGGSDPGSEVAAQSRTVGFDEDLSGYILLTSGGGRNVYPTKDGATGETLFIAAGDGPFGQVERGFLTFDLDVPAEATEIVSAELHLYLDLVSNDPYAELGDELDAHGVDYGGSLDANDYYSVPGEGPFTVNDSAADEDSWISADVTPAVADDWNRGEYRTQFMVKFPIDNNGDGTPHGVDLEGDGSSPEAPYLVIRYR